MGCVKITSLATYAFNAVMPLSRASTRGRYSHIEGVTTEYTNTGDFIPKLNENGAEVPPEWFGLNPADSEDSAEEIASSDEREDKEDEEDEDDAPEVGVDGQPRVDRASSTEPRARTSTAAEGDHPE